MSIRHFAIASIAALALSLTACASGGGGDDVDDAQGEQNVTSAQRDGGRFETFKGIDKKNYFRLVAKNGRMPTTPQEGSEQAPGSGSSEVETWARGEVGLISPLRRAAGMAKVEAAVDRIREHVEGTTDDSGRAPVYTRPLVVWVHHREVGDALALAVPAAVARTAILRGGVSEDKRGRIVDDFQDGKIPVLVASIAAAGVGITLTAACDTTFVETDWSSPTSPRPRTAWTVSVRRARSR